MKSPHQHITVVQNHNRTICAILVDRVLFRSIKKVTPSSRLRINELLTKVSVKPAITLEPDGSIIVGIWRRLE